MLFRTLTRTFWTRCRPHNSAHFWFRFWSKLFIAFLDELDNFKHFETYFFLAIFGPKNRQIGDFWGRQWRQVAKLAKIWKLRCVWARPLWWMGLGISQIAKNSDSPLVWIISVRITMASPMQSGAGALLPWFKASCQILAYLMKFQILTVPSSNHQKYGQEWWKALFNLP